MMGEVAVESPSPSHARWVKCTHWIVAASFLTLAVTGFVILMAHPRLYWGEVGNDLTPALVELPISRNYEHAGWDGQEPFSEEAKSPVSSGRTYDIFNENSWGRSLHFLAAWFLVLPGLVYLGAGIGSGHFRRHVLPGRRELRARLLWRDLVHHLRLRIGSDTPTGPVYGLLQKCGYAGVVFVVLPLAVLTGLAMSPAIHGAYPFLAGMFGGHQSARTIHFVAALSLVVFLVVHVAMVVQSGFRRQMRAMTFGRGS